MGPDRSFIKPGRLFMVASLAFYIFPIGAVLSSNLPTPEVVAGIGLLLGSALVWTWFWTRIIAGPDRRFVIVALVANGALLGIFTLRTPTNYGSLFVYVAVMAGAAFPWRVSVPLAIAVAAVSAGIDLVRGIGPLGATGTVINDLICGGIAVVGRLLVGANLELAAARERIARLAVDEERLRFARDLHDLLGHSLSVIALKSELAGRLLTSAPDKAAGEVADIEAVSREALREVREAVAGYRLPRLSAELAGAQEALSAAGIESRVQWEEATLTPRVEAVLAWAVREGATNVIRHSQAKRCSIRVASEDATASVEIVDDGRGGKPEPGNGLLGLKERVAQLDGRLEAGPLPHEGFRLRVRVPLTEQIVLSPEEAETGSR
jgi:two-component system, NarL family, sensor histidine kinase DesK